MTGTEDASLFAIGMCYCSDCDLTIGLKFAKEILLDLLLDPFGFCGQASPCLFDAALLLAAQMPRTLRAVLCTVLRVISFSFALSLILWIRPAGNVRSRSILWIFKVSFQRQKIRIRRGNIS